MVLSCFAPMHNFRRVFDAMTHARLFMMFTLALCWCAPIHAQHYYVSPAGSDAWSGLLKIPNHAKTDGPFATPARAVAVCSEPRRHAKSRSATRTITIDIAPGTYELHAPLRLTKLSHIRLRGVGNVRPVLTGSAGITHWKKLSDPDVLASVPENLRDSIIEIDLKENGIAGAGEITPRGGPALELFADGVRQTLARYPTSGWLLIAGVPQTGDSLYNKGLDRERRFDNVPIGRHYGRIQYDDDRITTWSRKNELLMQGYWTWDWSDSYQRVDSIIGARREIVIQKPHHWYGYTKHQRYCFYNILEELNRPGQWCISRSKGRIYAYPSVPMGSNTPSMRVSVLEEPMIVIDSCELVTVEGLAFRASRGSSVVINDGRDCAIERCTMTELGSTAVVIAGGVQNGIRSCDLYDLALGAIDLGGGDRASLSAAGNFCEDNDIHHYSRWLRTGQYAVRLSGVGNRLAHSLIHDAPFEAIYLSGNDHTVEYNDVHHVTQESGDAGALHTGRDWTWRGNRIQYNYFHHLQGKGLHGVMGVYLDDWASGFTVKGNVFYKAGRATMIGGGRDNLVENNCYIECAPSIHIDARGVGWGSYYFDGTYPDLFTKMDAMNYTQPPYSTRYPELLSLYRDDPALPRHNIIRANLSYGGRWMDVYDYRAFDFSIVTVRGNVIADTALMRRRRAGEKGWDPYYLNIDMQEGYELLMQGDTAAEREFAGNVLYHGNPGFYDIEHGDFRVRKDSPIWRNGFKPIPVEKIGLVTRRNERD